MHSTRVELTDIQKQMIEDALLKNEYCRIGILDDKRFFCGQRNSSPEFLVLVNSSVFYGEVWGHVFRRNKEWISCFVQITGWFSGRNEDELITNFWENIEQRFGWVDLNLVDEKPFLSRSDNLDQAIHELVKLIDRLDVNAVIDDAPADLSLYELYGYFPIAYGSLYSK